MPKMRLDLISSFGGECYYCPEKDPEQLVFAHLEDTEISGRGRGRKERYYDVKNNPRSYRLMCVECHKQHDKDPEEFEKRVAYFAEVSNMRWLFNE